ncbi:MAG: diaminopimelate decarboxylase [Gammaproteobacteria bacterium]
MDHFHYQHDELFAESVPVKDICKEFGTPCYIYSKATLEHHWHVFDQAFSKLAHKICFAVKANSNIAVLQVLARLGSGFDIVSLGELERVIKAGGLPQNVIFSGIGKSSTEITAALKHQIGCFNVESYQELEHINKIASDLNVKAPIALRINPNIDAGTHPYITTGLKDNKFGIGIEEAFELYQKANTMSHLELVGVAFHIGSQHNSLDPFLAALKKVLELVKQLQSIGIYLKTIDIGGGMGVRYHEESPPLPAAYAEVVEKLIHDLDVTIFVEPGRAIAANAGILVTKIEYIKDTPHRTFAIVDAGMNDLARPSLYNAYHNIIPVIQQKNEVEKCYDIVGPVCESADFLGKERKLAIKSGDLLAVRTSGAYGFVMSSNYNSRPKLPEILVDGDRAVLIRKRETMADLLALESLL